MKLMHFGDVHLAPENAENTRPALRAIVEAAERERPALIINTGDVSLKHGHLAPWVSHELREAHVRLARVAPVVVVAGNHDLATAGADVGTVIGALGAAEEHERINLFERPGIHTLCGRVGSDYLYVACLPYPSRRWLLANQPDIKASEINERLSAALLEVLNGLAAQIPPGAEAILVYHGSISGARTDTEQSMTTDVDMILHESEIPACFRAVLCGHIHRYQQIGRAVYAGSPTPLNFGETRSAHGYVMWDTEGWTHTFHKLPVAHPLIEMDLREPGADDPLGLRIGAPWPKQHIKAYVGARVKVLYRLLPMESAEDRRRYFTEALTDMGAHEVRVLIERPEALRVDAPEVHADASMDTLLDLYAERRPELAPYLDDLKGLAQEVDRQLPPDVVLRGQSAGFRVRRLEWENWKSYGAERVVLDFDTLGSIVVIEGNNGSGKSNAAEVECFALYGRFIPRGGDLKLKDAVRQGAGDAFVAAEFHAGSDYWRVERRIKVNSRGVGSSDLQLLRWWREEDRDRWIPASAGNARETQTLIESLVGPVELYLAARHASQGDIDHLFALTPADLTLVIQDALNTRVFEVRQRIAEGLAREAQRALDRFDGEQKTWRILAEQEETRAFAAAEAEGRLTEARAARKRSEEELRTAESAVRILEERLQGIAQAQEAWDGSHEAVGRAARTEAELRESIAAQEALVAAGAAAESRIAEEPRKRARLEALRDLQVRRYDAEAVLGDFRTVHKEAVAAHATARREHQAALDRARFDLQQATATAKREREAVATIESDWKDRIEERADVAAGTERAPFKGECVAVACPLLASAIEAKNGLEPLRARGEAAIAEQVARAEAAEKTVELVKDRPARLEQEWAEKEPGLLADIRAAQANVAEAETILAAIADPAEEIGALAAELEALEQDREAAASAATARVRADALRATLEGVEANHRETLARHKALGPRPDSDELEKEKAAAAFRYAGWLTENEKAQKTEQEAGEQLATARARLEASREAAAHLAGQAEQLLVLQSRCSLVAAYLAAVGRNGLPYLMLERALPALESHANHFLCSETSDLRLSIEGWRETQDGNARPEVTIRYETPLSLEPHPLGAASGAERTCLGYALRAALAQVQAEAQGVPLSLIWCDEGWGSYDDTRLTFAQQMLWRLAERFGRVVLISHQAPIREIAETRLVVERGPEGSTLRVAA